MRSADWGFLPYFLAVARAGNLRAGAALLNENYGTVNRNIQALEASYGAQLFNRSRRGFELTAAGHALVPLAEQAEATVITARKRVEGLDKSETGIVRFSLAAAFAYDIIAPIIGKFHKAYPEIQVELRVTSQIESIAENKTDVSLRAAFEVTDDVVARKLYPMAMGIYASKLYIDDHFADAGPKGAGLSWIGFPKHWTVTQWVEQSPFPLAEMRHIVSDFPMRFSLLRQHCGMSQLPVIFEKYYPDISRVPGTEVTLDRTLWILLHTDLRRTVRVRRFVDFLADELLKLQKDMQVS